MRRIAAIGLVAILNAQAHASGWHDYRLEIAPGFAVERMNSFEVCLAGPDGSLIVCPDDPPTFGPLVAYAVTADSILTRHFGARRDERNPSMWDADPTTELYLRVNRADLRVDGPYSRTPWQQAGLPSLSGVNWMEPKNPNFWTPFVGDVLFLLMTAYVLVWPLVLFAILLVGGVLLWVGAPKADIASRGLTMRCNGRRASSRRLQELPALRKFDQQAARRLRAAADRGR